MGSGRDGALPFGWQAPWGVTMTRPDRLSGRVASTADLDELDDRALVGAFVNGRHEAFDVIVRRHQRSVYRLCYRFAGNHEDAADLAQDVFVRAWRALPRFKGDAALGTWLYRIGVNVSLNQAGARKPPAEPIDPRRHRD